MLRSKCKISAFPIYVLCLLLHATLLAQTDEEDTWPLILDNANAGTEFYCSLPPVYEVNAPNSILFTLSAPHETVVTAEIVGTGLLREITVRPGVSSVLAFDAEDVQAYRKNVYHPLPEEYFYPQAALRLHSQLPFVATVVARFAVSSDGALLIPTSALGREYTISSFKESVHHSVKQNFDLPSMITISAAFDDTELWFRAGGNDSTRLNNGMLFGELREFKLNRGDVLLFGGISDGADLSGSHIKSNKPIAVYTANQCAFVGTEGTGFCDYIVSSETPHETWGKRYHFPRLVDRDSNAFVKIFAAQPETEVFRNGVVLATIDEISGREGSAWLGGPAADGPQDLQTFTSDKPIGVRLFNRGAAGQDTKTDSYSISLEPIEQYGTYRYFTIPVKTDLNFPSHLLSLIHAVSADGLVSADLEIGLYQESGLEWRQLRDVFGSAPGEIFPSVGDGKTWAEKRIEVEPGKTYVIRSSGEAFTAYVTAHANFDSFGIRSGAGLHDLTKEDQLAPQTSIVEGNIAFWSGVIKDTSANGDASGLAAVRLIPGSVNNATLLVDSFTPGETGGVHWQVNPIDGTQPAGLSFAMLDRRGNHKIIDLEYTPNLNSMFEVEPLELDYGRVKPGEFRQRFVTIRNVNTTAALMLSAVQFKHGDAGFELTESPPTPLFIPAAQSSISNEYNLSIGWRNADRGEFSDVLQIAAGDDDLMDYTVLRAETLIGKLRVNSVRFDNTTVGQTTRRPVNMINSGDLLINILDISTPSDPPFALEREGSLLETLPLAIIAGARVEFDAAFTPTERGEVVDYVTIRYRIGVQPDSTIRIALRGTGLDEVSSVEELSTVFGVIPTIHPLPAVEIAHCKFELLTA